MQKEKRKPKLLVWTDREEEIPLCEGIAIDRSVYDIKEGRNRVLLLKGFIVYLLTMGGIGFYMTAIEIDFSELIVHIVVFSTAMLCAILYRSYKAENIGYLIFFAIFVGLVMMFRTFINSGYYSIINDTTDLAAIYLDAEGMQKYNEQIQNRYLAITIFLCFLGTTVNIILNNYVSRRMRYIVCAVVTLTINLIPLYLEHEPDTIYTVMILSGLVMAYFVRSGQHFRLHRSDSVFSWRGPSKLKKKQRILKYAADWRSMVQGMIIAFVLVFTIVSTVMVIEPKEGYDSSRVDNPQKVESMEFMGILLMFGYWGLYDRYSNTGGLDSGQLGGVSQVRLDYQPDLRLIFAPYTRDTMYIANFIGTTYVPYENHWTIMEDWENGDNYHKAEADDLERAYEMHLPNTAKAKIMIQNIAADIRGYVPYYTNADYQRIPFGKAREITYYPREEGNYTPVSPHSVDEAYLDVPKANQDVIRAFCEEAGFGGTPQEIVEQVTDYFQENMPYTIKPGKTPRNQDFVNYFLTKQKKGYCSFFASSATLIFRYYGIPARYVEGYAISYAQVLDSGELYEEEEVNSEIKPTLEDYFDGYSELGETALIEIKPTDANAHAWVEIYDETYGWVPVEVTPAGGSDEDYEENFWDVFSRLVNDGSGSSDSGFGFGGDGSGFRLDDAAMQKAAFILLGIFLLVAAVFGTRLLVPVAVYEVKYIRAGRNDKLIMRYQKKLKRLSRRNKALQKAVNYREQLEVITGQGMTVLSETEKEDLLVTLETCGFSNREISDEKFRQTKTRIGNMKRLGRKKRKMLEAAEEQKKE